MVGTAKSSGKGTGDAKEASQVQQREPGNKVPEAVAKSASPKKVQRKPVRVSGKSVTPSRQSGRKPAKQEKQKKVKMVRDSFNMPESDYAKIAELKKKCLAAGVHVKKSELLRLGLTHLSKLSKSALLQSVKQVEKIKTGRPAKHRS